MIPGLVAGVVLPVAASTAAIRSVVPGAWTSSRTLVLSLGTVVALGLSSVLFAFSLFAFGPGWSPYVHVETAIWIAVLVASLLTGRKGQPPLRERRSFTAYELVAGLVFAATLAMSFLHFYWSSANFPSGDWDAQAIWTLRARFLSRGLEGHWRDGFLPVLAWSLPDYPIMLPSSIARLWVFTASESPLMPIAIAALFKYSTVGMVVGALMVIRGRWEAFCAGAVVLASLGFNAWGAGQIADVPLGAFMLASTIMMSWILERRPGSTAGGMAALLTFCAGCAAWTKNEGLVFAAAICGVLVLVMGVRRQWLPRTLLAACGGLFIPVAALYLFKHNIAPPNYLFQGSNLGTLTSKLWDWERHEFILRSFMGEFWSWNGSEPIGPIPLVVAYALGASALHGLRRAQLVALLPLAGMLAGYYASYVLTPFDLKWHVTSSLARLIVQIWPAAVYACFCIPGSLRARHI